MIRTLRRAWIAATLACLAVLFVPGLAGAAFPGDNGKIAFETDRHGKRQIYVVNPDGSGETRLTNNSAYDEQPAWSPDGRKIAFTSNRDGNYEIYVMNADGSGQTRITNAPSAVDTWPTWSPDGSGIAFVSYESGNSGLFVMNADGSGKTRIADHTTEPDWSPDGSRIAYTELTLYDLRLVNPDGTGGTTVQEGFLDPCSSTSNDGADWSPDGAFIVFRRLDITDSSPFGECESVDYQWQVFSFRVGTSETGGPNKSGASPTWSPDGTKVAYIAADNSPSPNGELWVTDLDGSPEAPIVNSSGKEYNPDWQSVRPPGYARPLGATPTKVKVVPAYQPCAAANATHGTPLQASSCSPPVPSSSYLTIGSPDANGQIANSTGFVMFETRCNPPAPGPYPPCTSVGDQIDAALTASVTDVRNKVGLNDYTGELRVAVTVRVTDRFNGPGGVHPGTALDSPLGFNMTCQPTADTTVGSTCSASTSADALMPGFALEGKRAVWELGQIQVYDGGADGDADTTGDNTLFEVQGLFAP